MRRPATFVLAGCLAGLLGLAAGCRSVPVRILNLIGLSQKPLVFLHVAEKSTADDESLGELIDPFAPYRPLRQALSQRIERHVVPELCFAFQVEPALQLGTCHLAVISPVHYAAMSQRERFEVVAVPIDASGQSARPALLVVREDSPLARVEDLKGESVAFGPAQHPRAHIAALALLEAHHVKRSDLALEALPIPGSLKHINKPRDVALAVLRGRAAAGFIDEAGWDRLPESAEGDAPSRDKFRVLARTAPLPNRLIIASPKLEPETVERIREFFLTVDERHPAALEPLQVKDFAPADPVQVATWLETVASDQPGVAFADHGAPHEAAP